MEGDVPKIRLRRCCWSGIVSAVSVQVVGVREGGGGCLEVLGVGVKGGLPAWGFPPCGDM